MNKWAPDMIETRYLFWAKLQPLIVIISVTFGYFIFGWAGLFWLGACAWLIACISRRP